MRFEMFLILLLLLGCSKKDPESLMGQYEGFWGDTEWTIRLMEHKQFQFTVAGHAGSGTTSGKYEVRGDTLILNSNDTSQTSIQFANEKYLIERDSCLISLENRYDYCKIRPDSGWTVHQRNINYPQTKAHFDEDKTNALKMLQTAIRLIPPKHIEDTTSNLILQEHFEFNKSNNVVLTCLGLEVLLLSEHEIKTKGLTNYINIQQFTMGLNRSLVHLRVQPYLETFGSVIVSFDKIDGEWVMEPNYFEKL